MINAQANMVYQADLDSLDATRIAEFIRHHKANQVPRLQMLDQYYKAQDDGIMSPDNRRTEDGKSDHRAVHSFAKYIADFQTAFSVGNPINVKLPKESEEFDKLVRANDMDAHNYDMFLDMTRYGRAYEYIYRGTDDEEHIVKLDPLNTFVIYDTSVDPQPVMAVRYHELQDVNADGVVINKYVPETWTDTEHVVYKPTLAEAALIVDYSEPQVTFPVVEYKNNAFRIGDYENVISLIDLYDAAQSDTANYMTDLNDAMLVIKGDIDTLFDDSMLLQGIDPNDEEQMKELAQNKLDMLKEMRSANMLLLKSGSTVTGAQTSVDAEYIHKEYDVNGAEAYKKRIAADIHKFSHTPDMTDENFAGNSSGVAMEYKLLGTFELASTKRRAFNLGMYKRYEIIQRFETDLFDTWDIEAGDITFTYRDNLPTDDVTTVKTLVDAGAQIPQEYLYQFLPGVTDVQEIIDMMDKQREQTANTMGGVMYGRQTDDGSDEEVRGRTATKQSDGSEEDN